MTLQEVAKELGYSPYTIKRSLARTQETLLKNKGIKLKKINSNNYEIEYIPNFEKPKKENKKHTELVGKKYGALTVIEDSGKRLHRSIVWRCKCDCGKEHFATTNNLNSGGVKSCGSSDCPYHKTYEDLTNQKFGMLTAIKPIGVKDGCHMYWLCQCECGNLKEVASNHLKRGTVSSCGCLKTSLGEKIIKEILEKNNIIYKEQVIFSDLTGKTRPLRYDFGIYENGSIVRLVEFDGIQHFEQQTYFSHDLIATRESDEKKNEYAKKNNIPLIRIPYWEKNNLSLELILGDKYLI